jgi:two-component system response regulator HydG
MKLIMGQSDASRQIDQSVNTLATSDGTVCVYGERGTGKTLIAQAIHARDPRRAGRPLVVVHCTTLPPDFTEGDKIFDLFEGAFQVANGGTLVLKQVASLSAASQTVLLHTIKQHASIDGGIRVIATTTTDLFPMMQHGQFHTDLFHRLAGITIPVPPLRKRKADIPWLIAHFLRSFNTRHGWKDIRGITHEALRVLLKHDWPGNVRELKCCIERACMRTHRAVINDTELEDTIDALKV